MQARVVCLIYTLKAQGLKVYILRTVGKPQVPMLQLLYNT